MPRKARKEEGRSRRLGENEADVTLNEFANSNTSGKKLKKPAVNIIKKQVDQLRTFDDDLDWFEKDLEYFDFPSGEEEEEDERKSKKKNKKRQTKRIHDQVETADDGIRYPIDIWFLISDFIYPEDIITFACICKDALTVVNSVKFWLSLYKRQRNMKIIELNVYYNQDVNLPERLRPQCMERPFSLRACVVRSLYYTYPLFVNRLHRQPTIDKAHQLVKRRCILMWYQQTNNNWNFYFKFKSNKSRSAKIDRRSLMQSLDDINANPEAGCQVLQVSCKYFIPTPIVMGMILANISLNSNQKMQDYRLHLTFDPTCYINSAGGILVTLEPVANVRVLDWWHPQYPWYSR
uniref:F-box domain-containing protein n=1 Tax=Strigamia maritima TaxID=126957 RepID=T1JE09_STRMM